MKGPKGPTWNYKMKGATNAHKETQEKNLPVALYPSELALAVNLPAALSPSELAPAMTRLWRQHWRGFQVTSSYFFTLLSLLTKWISSLKVKSIGFVFVFLVFGSLFKKVSYLKQSFFLLTCDCVS